jgi:hypothetical protein
MSGAQDSEPPRFREHEASTMESSAGHSSRSDPAPDTQRNLKLTLSDLAERTKRLERSIQRDHEDQARHIADIEERVVGLSKASTELGARLHELETAWRSQTRRALIPFLLGVLASLMSVIVYVIARYVFE